MNALMTFDFEDQPVRTLMIDGEPWFVGKDVCRCLGIVNHRDALGRLADDERRNIDLRNAGIGGCSTPPYSEGLQNRVGTTDPIAQRGNPNATAINEPGVYRLVFESRKPEAERFRRWVFHEVLPSIRKTGSYVPGRAEWEEMREKITIVRETRLAHGRDAAREIWAYLGLPDVGGGAPEAQGGDELLRYIADFLEECTVRDAASSVRSSELHQVYNLWATATKSPHFTATMFGHMARRADLLRHRTNGQTLYRGLRILPDIRQKLRGPS